MSASTSFILDLLLNKIPFNTLLVSSQVNNEMVLAFESYNFCYLNTLLDYSLPTP